MSLVYVVSIFIDDGNGRISRYVIRCTVGAFVEMSSAPVSQ